MNHREKAWEILNLAKIQQESNESTKTCETLIDHMLKNIPMDHNPDTIENEIYSCVYDTENFVEKGCSNTAFCILILRTGLKYYKLPIVRAVNWQAIAGQYSKIILNAGR